MISTWLKTSTLVAALALFSAAPTQAIADADRIGELLNAERSAQGLRQVRQDRLLNEAAMAQAMYMQRTGEFSHRGEGGSNVGHRVSQTGYCFRTAAENIAWNYPEPERLMNGWMNSPGHRANNLSNRVTQYGYAQSANYQVLVLGRPC